MGQGSLSTFVSKILLSDASFAQPLAASTIRWKCQTFPWTSLWNGFERWHQKVRNASPFFFCFFCRFEHLLKAGSQLDLDPLIERCLTSHLAHPSILYLGERKPGEREGLMSTRTLQRGDHPPPLCRQHRPALRPAAKVSGQLPPLADWHGGKSSE